MSERTVRYTIREDERFGNGEYGLAYLARKEGEIEGVKKLYVIKIPIEKKINDENKLIFNNEINILNRLIPIPENKYTPIIYDYRKFTNIKKEEDKKEEDKSKDPKKEENDIKDTNAEVQKLNDKNEVIEIIKTPFYVMDYFSKGLLHEYLASGMLLDKPKLVKFIFRRIIISYKTLHSQNICHLDIKPDNIIFDKDFYPIIIDFGFSIKYEKEKGIDVCYGSREYATPEAWKGRKVNGEKADIFSLGAILFNLVTGRYGFESSKSSDKKYNLIKENKIEEYWKVINIKNLADDFKKLFISMVSYKAETRPTFDEILNSDYLAEVKDLSINENDEFIQELNIIYDSIKDDNERIIEQKIRVENLNTRCDGKKKMEFFKNHNLEPKQISKDRLNLNQYIKINGNFSALDFMNTLANEINKKYEGFCNIEPLENLRFEAIFTYGKEIGDKIIVEKEKEKEKGEENEEEEEEESNENCKMEVELFAYEKGRYLLEFRRTGGKVPSYYQHFFKIKEIVKKMKI